MWSYCYILMTLLPLFYTLEGDHHKCLIWDTKYCNKPTSCVTMESCSKLAIICTFAVLIRWSVSLFGYSGAGKGPMFGDYEAQRHWQEITVNLPVKQWYVNSSDNDLQYWGLDYPPLTAYHSYLCGVVARYINPDWVALFTSRGYESYLHKLFMRYSVLLVDLLVYIPAVLWIFNARKQDPKNPNLAMKCILLTLLYPGLVLIDYGHFQYNCISLGFAVMAVASLTSSYYVLGSAFFCLALNYKQMELYHAMPFFCYLLGSCLRDFKQGGIFRLIKIGLTVIVTFGICWAPFLYSVDSTLQVLHRLFPFARGIFEDKVSNVWCALSVLIKWKQVLTRDQILQMCLCSTVIGILPSSLHLICSPSIKSFKYSLVNCSMVFFLFSFQVHEKSILIPAISVCILMPDHPFWCFWFLQISTFSMLPLLIKDGLLVPYLSLMCMYGVLYYNFHPGSTDSNRHKSDTSMWIHIFEQLAFCISTVGVVILTLSTVLVPPPEHLPDLFPLIVSIFSCAHFILFTLYFHYCQFSWNYSSGQSKRSDGDAKLDNTESVKSKIAKSKYVKIKKKKQH